MVKKKNLQSYTDEFKKSVLARVSAGESVSTVAFQSKVHFGTVYAWMKAAGIKPRMADKVGGAAKGKKKKGRPFGSKNGAAAPIGRDVLLFLRHSKAEILKEFGNSGKLSRANLLTLLALDSLEGA